MNPMISNPDDDPSQKAVILIDKLTVALGDLKQQVEANAKETALLSKLNQNLQQKLDDLRIPRPPTPPTSPAPATKPDLDTLEQRIEDRIFGLHARCYALLAAGIAGLVIVTAVAVKVLL